MLSSSERGQEGRRERRERLTCPCTSHYHASRAQGGRPSPPLLRSLSSLAQEIRTFLEKPDEAGLTDMASKMLESDPELQAQMLKIQEAMVRVDK